MKPRFSNNNQAFLTKKFVFILLLAALFNQISSAQQNLADITYINEENFSEELYIKTDRDIYIAGEKVWIKVYKLNGLTHTPSDISKVVLIDFLGIDNNPVRQLKLLVDGNSAGTGLILPDTLSTGNYIIRSYTNWMRNFSPRLFSYKKISVINPFKNISSIKLPPRENIPDTVLFFPEGGHLSIRN